jgi:hypothetical protein
MQHLDVYFEMKKQLNVQAAILTNSVRTALLIK